MPKTISHLMRDHKLQLHGASIAGLDELRQNISLIVSRTVFAPSSFISKLERRG